MGNDSKERVGLENWRVLIAAGLVFVLIGVLMRDQLGSSAVVIGLICLVAGGAWRVLRGPSRD